MSISQSKNLPAVESAAIPWHGTIAGRTFIAVAVAHAIVDFSGGVWPLFKNLAKLDLQWAGLIATISAVFGSALQPLFGYYADRGHRRFLILTGLALMGAMALLGTAEIHRAALGPTGLYLALLAIMLVIRLGQAMFHPPAASLAGNTAANRRSTLVALFISAGMIGMSVSWFLFGAIYKAFDRNTLWLLLPFIPLAVWITRWCRPVDGRHADVPSPLKVLGELAHAGPTFFMLYLIQVFVSAAYEGLTFLLPEFIEVRHYPPWFRTGGGLFCYVFGAAAIMVPMSLLGDRLGRRGMLQLMLLGALVVLAILLGMGAPPLATFALLLLVTGGCLGATNPLSVAFAQHLAPRHASVISGIMMGLAWMVGGVSPSILGYLVEGRGMSIVGALRWLMLPVAAALLLSLLLPKQETA